MFSITTHRVNHTSTWTFFSKITICTWKKFIISLRDEYIWHCYMNLKCTWIILSAMKTACALCMTRMFWSYDKTSKSSILVASQFWPAAFYWSHLRLYLKMNIFTVRKLGGEGNVFSRVCVSAERAGALDGGAPSRTGLWPYPPA